MRTTPLKEEKKLSNDILRNVIEDMKGLNVSVSSEWGNAFEHEKVEAWVEREDEAQRIEIEFYIRGYYSEKRCEYVVEEFTINKAWVYDEFNDEVYLNEEQLRELEAAVEMFLIIDESSSIEASVSEYKIRINKYQLKIA